MAFFSRYLPSVPRSFRFDRQAGHPAHQLVIEQRLAHFQGVRHAGAVDLGEDVADQVGLHVEILHQRERIVGGCHRGVAAQHFHRLIALQLALE